MPCLVYYRFLMTDYPPARKSDVVDDYHGTRVPDPYRWLEDPDSEETRAWIEAENRVTFDFLEKIPERSGIRRRLTQLWDYEKYGIPQREGNRYFFFKNDGLQNQSVLYVTDSLEAEARVLLDPNQLSEDGTVALSAYAISEDGNLLAYGLSASGSDWMEWRVRDVNTGQDLPDVLHWIKFSSVAWTHNGHGFFYSRYNEPAPGSSREEANYYNKLYYHALGTPQSQDRLICERADQKEWSFHPHVTEDGRYLMITISKGTDPRYQVWFQDLQDEPRLTELIAGFDAEYSFVGNDGAIFWFKTNLEAPRGRVIAIDIRTPSRDRWREVIPQSSDVLEGASVCCERFFASYLKDAHSEIREFDLRGNFLRNLALPEIGTASGPGGKRADTETFYAFTSFTRPTVIYRYDPQSGASHIFREPKLTFDPSEYETREVFSTSKDGTKVPMFLVHHKGRKRDRSNRVYLYGYGGFNISMTPAFSVSALAWMELGGIFAVACLRGGGEYGQEWHKAGTRERKQNVFDDFIASAEWLMDNGYTVPQKLAIGGGSNGGLLVAACMVQRPDLFGAVCASVGVMDMLRFQKFTIGWAWVDDYGSAENPKDFEFLYAYSPLHNLKPGTKYPAVFISTADHDDRVVPAHSFKFAAALQEAHAGDAPVLIRIETKAGHGAGKPTAKLIEEISDKWAFLLRVLT